MGLSAGLRRPGSGETGLTALLAFLREHSPFLDRLASADPARVERLGAMPPEQSLAAIVAAQRAVGRDFAAGALDRAAASRALRLNRGEHALLVALADLGGVWGVDDVVAALTAFADASVASALDITLAEAVAARQLALDPADPQGSCGLAVLALGKHGAGELNYSSDIDLVVFFDPASPAVTGSGGPSKVYTRVTQAIAKLLEDRTVDGYVHRVDYRLRPDPASTPVAVSLPVAYGYYETVGQNWERAAFIKARPIAGDAALGERFLRDLEPFIWRKYFDLAAIADIHAMKRQIHVARGHGSLAVAGHDIKIGRGGIREIEFFVQTQQLVFGGRRPGLRDRRTLTMLDRFASEGWIGEAARDELAAAYRFLRETEHRIQMVADEQTQRLPTGEALDRFATFCGFADLPAFSAALTAHAENVQRHYGLLFEAEPELALDAGSLVFTGTGVDPETVETLRRLGFREPEAAAETVRGWHFGRRPAITSARAREVLTELTPALLGALGGTADPDGALARLDRAFARMPAAVELLVVLRSQEKLRTLFADLLGSAPRLAETVAATPHVLDAVLEPRFASPDLAPGATDAEFASLLGSPRDTEEFLDRLRDAARLMNFAAGARLLSEIVSPRDAGALFAGIAESGVRAALRWVEAAFRAEHGGVAGGRLAVLGLGRLGARDLTANSDLDLVVLYDFDPAARTSDGPRPLDAVVYYLRLTQRLVSALTVPTRRGRLYEVDLRLRPSGTKGPVASQLGGFLSYYDGEADLWEHMALTRARVLAGDAGFGREVGAAIGAILARPREVAAVYAGVAAMHDLVMREKGDPVGWDMKLADGGLTDLDFLAQALLLAHAAPTPALLADRSTAGVFDAAASVGLLPADDHAVLAEAFRLFDETLHWQRLGTGDAAGEVPAAAMLKRLATALGAPGPEQLKDRLDAARTAVRARFDAILRGVGEGRS